MPYEGFRVLYAALKVGILPANLRRVVELEYEEAAETPAVLPLVAPPESRGTGISQFAAFKKFYQAVATCHATNIIMTDPVMGPDGYCYQRGSEPRTARNAAYWNRIDKEAALVNGSNITLKKALETMSKKSTLSLTDYAEFFKTIATDYVSFVIETDPILDAGYIRGEKMLQKAMQPWDINRYMPDRPLVNADTCVTGAVWDESNPRPSIYIRYIQMQKAMVTLRDDLNSTSPVSKEIYAEIHAAKNPDNTDVIVVKRKLHETAVDPVLLLQHLGMSVKLSRLIAQDPALTQDVLKNKVNAFLRSLAELAYVNPTHAAIALAMTATLVVLFNLYLGWLHILALLFISIFGLKGDKHIEKTFGIPEEDRSATMKVQLIYAMLFILITYLAKKGLDSTDIVRGFIDHSPIPVNMFHNNQEVHEYYFSVSFSIVIAAHAAEELVKVLVKATYRPPEGDEIEMDELNPPAEDRARNRRVN